MGVWIEAAGHRRIRNGGRWVRRWRVLTWRVLGRRIRVRIHRLRRRLTDHVHILTVYVAGGCALRRSDDQALVESLLSEAHVQATAADADEDRTEGEREEGARYG